MISRAMAMRPPPAAIFGWLHVASFDLTLIIGAATLALLSGVVVVFNPNLFYLVLFGDMWFLGYQHFIAMFTRLIFDMESFREHKFLIIKLPFIIVIGVTISLLVVGPWLLATAYFYWQWFHYTRQSYGIARVYQCKVEPQENILDKLVIYFIPITGILYRSYQGPEYFLGLEIRVIPIPTEVMRMALFLSAIILFLWMIKQILMTLNQKTSIACTLFLLCHILIFTVGYIAIDQLNHGWLVLNIWHNVQYILFVWVYNNKRFKNRIEEEHRFLSYLSLAKNQWLYYLFSFILATLVFILLDKLLGSMRTSIASLALIVYLMINFYHYVVDGIIWRVKKKPFRQILELKEVH